MRFWWWNFVVRRGKGSWRNLCRHGNDWRDYGERERGSERTRIGEGESDAFAGGMVVAFGEKKVVGTKRGVGTKREAFGWNLVGCWK